MGGIVCGVLGYPLRLVCFATKKCVEQARGPVLILYSKATFWEICKAICVRCDPEYIRNLASLGINAQFILAKGVYTPMVCGQRMRRAGNVTFRKLKCVR